MRLLLQINEFLNRRAPMVKDVVRAITPHRLRTKFADRKFTLTIEADSYSCTFANIHSKNWWGSEESVSGCGSELSRTVTIRRELPRWIRENGIRSVLDAPCGDFNWMSEVVKTSSIRYFGADIVEGIVKANRSRFTSDQVSFSALDILHDDLPEADAWLCRDVLFHFPNDAVAAMLKRFHQSKIRFLLTSHFKNTVEHPDIKFGGYRPVNLCRPPFDWPEPAMLIFDGDGGSEPDRYLAIWRNPNASMVPNLT